MSQPRSRTLTALDNFNIAHPATDEAVTLLPGNFVSVEVDDLGGHDAFKVAIYDICVFNLPLSPDGSTVPLTQQGGGNTWTGTALVTFLDPFDILENHKQIVAYGRIGTTWSGPHTNPFRINRNASCTGSGSGIASGSGSQQRCNFCSATALVPVTLRLTHGGGITSATCLNCEALNSSILLCHSSDACFLCCWFSGPIAFCGTDPGFWKLEKKDARIWELRLLQAQAHQTAEIARYKFSTAADNICTFPITLSRDTVAGVCTGWPDTITLDRA